MSLIVISQLGHMLGSSLQLRLDLLQWPYGLTTGTPTLTCDALHQGLLCANAYKLLFLDTDLLLVMSDSSIPTDQSLMPTEGFTFIDS